MNWESDGNGGINFNVQKRTLKKHGSIWGVVALLVGGGGSYTAIDGYQAIKEAGVREAKLGQIEETQEEQVQEFKEFKVEIKQKFIRLEDTIEKRHSETQAILMQILTKED